MYYLPDYYKVKSLIDFANLNRINTWAEYNTNDVNTVFIVKVLFNHKLSPERNFTVFTEDGRSSIPF